MSTATPAPSYRILLVDDHPTFRHGLAQLITAEEGLTICGEAGDAAQGISAARALKPELIILDISLPGSNGLELIKMILAELPQMPILVLSVHDESHFAIRAIRAGAKGYLMKSETPEQIVSAIRILLGGGSYLSLSLADRLIFKTIQSIDAGVGSPIDNLSDRELEVFQRLGEGLGTREIAELLHLSMKTVETHRAHIKEKLACKSGSEVVRFAIDWVTRESV
jgi:DNA-binding NarL/FixJ family response regulator